LRLPGAAAHALEQHSFGYKKFPFGTVELESESTKEQA
jgi:citrate synthase